MGVREDQSETWISFQNVSKFMFLKTKLSFMSIYNVVRNDNYGQHLFMILNHCIALSPSAPIIFL